MAYNLIDKCIGWLRRITDADGLPDGSRKPGEAMWAGIVPDLKRTAKTEDEQNCRRR